MFSITEGQIRSLATSLQVYQRGWQYYKQKRVIDLEFDLSEPGLKATVQGSTVDYRVGISFTAKGSVRGVICECPAFYRYDGICKHLVAVLLAARQSLGEGGFTAANNNKTNRQLAEQILAYFEDGDQKPGRKTLQLELNLEINAHSCHPSQRVYSLTLRLGEDRLYVVKNAKVFFDHLVRGEPVVFGKKFTFDPRVHAFHPGDEPIIQLLGEIYEVEERVGQEIWHNGSGSASGFFKGKKIFLTPSMVRRLWPLLPSGAFNLTLFEQEFRQVETVEQDLPLQFTLNKNKRDLLLQTKQGLPYPLEPTGTHFFYDNKVYHISEQQSKLFLPFYHAFLEKPDGISFEPGQQQQFVSRILPAMRKIGQVEIAPAIKNNFYEADLAAKIYLNREQDTVTAVVEFIYGRIKLNPFAAQPGVDTGNRILVRDWERERAILGLLEKTAFINSSGTLHLHREEDIYDFIAHVLPDLHQWAEIYYADSFRRMQVRSATAVTGGVRLNEEKGLLEFSFTVDDIDQAELPGIFQALREKKKYHRLRDGTFLTLDDQATSLVQARQMLDNFNINEGQLQQKFINLPKFRALYIDRCLKEANIKTERNLAFKQLVQNVTAPQAMDYQIPEGFQGHLRSYQKTGFKWLKTLAHYGLGGILADDMGLGKTIQTLVFILSEREQGSKPTLVVAPTSVVYNWQDEAARFTPDLKVVVVTGTPRERRDLVQQAREADLVITSYALLRRDVELYQDVSFGYCFLDEAQQIKNPGSLSSKAVKQIQARGYFALTGTPLENNLTELWSVFDFVMRGYLLSHRQFSQKYEQPIVKNQEQGALEGLQKQITPFILRRLKRDVLQELPPKIESRVLIDLTREQKQVYLAYLQRAKGEFETVVTSGGFARNQIKILSLLTRLRQICCHPATFLENYQGDSGKLEYLQETIPDAIAGGHRILLFSQFTGALEIIRQYFDSVGVNYLYLDGATPVKERGRLVQDFNQGRGEVFLISLKAGGTGLNLTGADMVIHYDPWWNPAVEEQATDRAYRIGQKNSVQVIKLITRGTIEESIYELQQKKKAMIDTVLQPGDPIITKLTEQELREILWA